MFALGPGASRTAGPFVKMGVHMFGIGEVLAPYEPILLGLGVFFGAIGLGLLVWSLFRPRRKKFEQQSVSGARLTARRNQRFLRNTYAADAARQAYLQAVEAARQEEEDREAAQRLERFL